MSEAFNWSYLHLLFYIYELQTHFGSNPPIHMLVVYKLSWKWKKMCMKKNKRVPSVSVPQRNAFAFETSCCSTQHPDVCFCVVMTALEDSSLLQKWLVVPVANPLLSRLVATTGTKGSPYHTKKIMCHAGIELKTY